jgi:acetylornithine deacetylase/succinyl-diaminopimelate desuccinylase-like protein
MRQLLDRIDSSETGTIMDEAFNVTVPDKRVAQARIAAEVLDKTVYTKFPFISGSHPVIQDPTELVLNRTWHPSMSIIGADGLPSIANAGNVLLPSTSVKISLRLPPTCNSDQASGHLKTLLESDPPYGAKVTFTPDWAANGWHAPEMQPWLEQAIDKASRTYFGNQAVHMGEGGTIPFMGMLGEKFPEAQFLITGVLGPHSNAHGPNEFLHIPTAKKLTCCVADLIATAYNV